jgi:Flp pilus assembly protein TadG
MLMVLFFALMAVAIDVGHMLNERRHMQNAADAGALAGAWELCFGEPSQAEATAREYAIDRNGAETADVSVGPLRVTVYAREATGLYLARLFGIETADINARAVAACGAANSGCNIWPVAFPQTRWHELTGGPTTCVAGEHFYVWAGHQEGKGPDCTVYDCDTNNNGVDDVIDFRGRAFLDFGDDKEPPFPNDCRQPGCGDAELKCWILNPDGGRVDWPACIPGTTGVKAGVHMEVDARAASDDPIVGIPIYDQRGCEGTDEVDPGYCPGSERFHVVEVGCVEVIGWVQHLTLERLPGQGEGPPWKDKAIEVVVTCDGCVTECGSTIGETPAPWEMTAVSLIE